MGVYAPKPESHTRIAIKKRSAVATPVTPGNDDAIRVIDPVLSPILGDRYQPGENWDSRLTEQSTLCRKHRTLNHKAYMYVPSTAANFIVLGNYYEKLLCPAGMTRATVGPNEVFSPATVTSDPLDLAVCDIFFQEWTETEKVWAARNNFKLDMKTNEPLLVENDWLGRWRENTGSIDEGIPATGTTLLTKPDHAGVIQELQQATVKIGPADDYTNDAYYLALKQIGFDFGNQPVLFDDGSGIDGFGGVLCSNVQDGQKLTLDVAMPKLHGTAKSATAFPWLSYQEDGTYLYLEITMMGSTDYGMKMQWIFQIEDEPSRSKADGLRRLSLSGTCKNGTRTSASETTEDIAGFKLTLLDESIP